jgi:hypothetical protein
MSGAMAGMGMGSGIQRGGDDAGLSQEDLTSQLASIGNADSNRASMLSSLLDNFDQVDTDSNGKVSFDETRAYKQSGQSAAATTNTSSEAEVLMQIMNLAQAYGLGGSNASGASLSVSA